MMFFRLGLVLFGFFLLAEILILHIFMPLNQQTAPTGQPPIFNTTTPLHGSTGGSIDTTTNSTTNSTNPKTSQNGNQASDHSQGSQKVSFLSDLHLDQVEAVLNHTIRQEKTNNKTGNAVLRESQLKSSSEHTFEVQRTPVTLSIAGGFDSSQATPHSDRNFTEDTNRGLRGHTTSDNPLQEEDFGDFSRVERTCIASSLNTTVHMSNKIYLEYAQLCYNKAYESHKKLFDVVDNQTLQSIKEYFRLFISVNKGLVDWFFEDKTKEVMNLDQTIKQFESDENDMEGRLQLITTGLNDHKSKVSILKDITDYQADIRFLIKCYKQSEGKLKRTKKSIDQKNVKDLTDKPADKNLQHSFFGTQKEAPRKNSKQNDSVQ